MIIKSIIEFCYINGLLNSHFCEIEFHFKNISIYQLNIVGIYNIK